MHARRAVDRPIVCGNRIVRIYGVETPYRNTVETPSNAGVVVCKCDRGRQDEIYRMSIGAFKAVSRDRRVTVAILNIVRYRVDRASVAMIEQVFVNPVITVDE